MSKAYNHVPHKMPAYDKLVIALCMIGLIVFAVTVPYSKEVPPPEEIHSSTTCNHCGTTIIKTKRFMEGK